jgi:hypothetical protein
MTTSRLSPSPPIPTLLLSLDAKVPLYVAVCITRNCPLAICVAYGIIKSMDDTQRFSVARREEHTLTTFEALKIFEQQGLPRSQRAIERYCKAEKLDCFFDVDEQRYYITQASIERLIGHLKEIQARHEHAQPVPSPTASDSVRPGRTTAKKRTLTASVKEVGVLETKLLQLEAPRERVIDTEDGSIEGARDYAR